MNCKRINVLINQLLKWQKMYGGFEFTFIPSCIPSIDYEIQISSGVSRAYVQFESREYFDNDEFEKIIDRKILYGITTLINMTSVRLRKEAGQ